MITSVTYHYDPKEYDWITDVDGAEQKCRDDVHRNLWPVPVIFNRTPGRPLTADIPGGDGFDLDDAYFSFDYAFEARR